MKKQKKFKWLKFLKLTFFLLLFLLSLFGLLFAITLTNKTTNNPILNNKNNLTYVRSPYGVEFKVKNTNNLKFIYALSHFDSAGVLKTLNSINETELESNIKNQGTQEIKEANEIVDVLNFFVDKFTNKNIIFMGDTNIKLGNENLAFKNLFNTQYQMLFEDSEIYNTTLSTSFVNKFVNPYDKFIYFLDNDFSLAHYDSYEDIEKIIISDFKNGFAINPYNLLTKKYYQNGIGVIDYIDNLYQNKLIGFVRNAISDHTPIGFDLNYLDINNLNQKIRIGGWNVYNFNLDTGNLFETNVNYADKSLFKKQLHAINIAKIINYANFDLIGLLEINKNKTEKDLVNFLDYLNSLFKSEDIFYEAFLSENSLAINPNSNQIEQVLLIYNKNKIFMNFEKEAIFYKFNFNTTYLMSLNSFFININEIVFIKERYFEN